MVAEYANDRSRTLAVAIMAAGYPMGAIVGGAISSNLLATGGWRDVFHFGAIATAVFFPIAWFLLPESVGYLMQRRPADLLSRVNKALRGVGHSIVDSLPNATGETAKTSVTELFSPGLRRTTLLLTIGYFTHIMTFYFILKWIPKIVVDMGYEPSAAGGVLVWANVGGLTGALLLSVLSLRIPTRVLVISVMLLSVIMVSIFGQGQADLGQLSLIAAAAGFCTNAGVVGLYAIIASSFPTAVRGGGTGFVIGFGRGGAALGPIFAGLLFSFDFGLPVVAIMMASGSLVAAVTLYLLKPEKPEI
jgi:MFS family permease